MPKTKAQTYKTCYGYPRKHCETPKLAHEFINYVLTYEASLGNSEYVHSKLFQPGSSG